MTQEEKNVLPVILSNLQKAAEKQQEPVVAGAFAAMESEYDKGSSNVKSFSALKGLVSSDLSEVYPSLQGAAADIGDRGAMRALRWGQKVTAIQKSLIDRYETKGEALLEGKSLFVCEACGFIFLGDVAPDVCPVCKAPSSRFIKV